MLPFFIPIGIASVEIEHTWPTTEFARSLPMLRSFVPLFVIISDKSRTQRPREEAIAIERPTRLPIAAKRTGPCMVAYERGI